MGLGNLLIHDGSVLLRDAHAQEKIPWARHKPSPHKHIGTPHGTPLDGVRYSHLGDLLKDDIAMRRMPALKMVEYKVLGDAIKEVKHDATSLALLKRDMADPTKFSARCDEIVVMLRACKLAAPHTFGVDAGINIARLETLRVQLLNMIGKILNDKITGHCNDK